MSFIVESYEVRGPRPAAILAGFDGAGAFAGETVYTRGGDAVAVPAATSQRDGGRYLDVVQFLNGYGSQVTLSAQANTAWVANTGGGSASVGIDADDRFYFQASAFFDLIAYADDPWGFPEGSTEAVVVGGAYRVTGTLRWTRGAFHVSSTTGRFSIDPAVGTTFAFPGIFSVPHSIPTMIRGAVADEDDATTMCLEKWEDDATGAPGRTRFGVDITGRVFCATPSVDDPIVWAATAAGKAFRFALGFNGAEVPVTTNGRNILTAAYPCPGVLVVRRMLARWSPEFHEITDTIQMPDGSVRGRTSGTAVQWPFGFWAGGPSDQVDDEGHMLRHVIPRLTRGARCSVNLVWGDPRRARHPVELLDGDEPTLFDESITTERGGLMGRRVGRVSPDSPDSRAWAYARSRVRSEHTLILRESD